MFLGGCVVMWVSLGWRATGYYFDDGEHGNTGFVKDIDVHRLFTFFSEIRFTCIVWDCESYKQKICTGRS